MAQLLRTTSEDRAVIVHLMSNGYSARAAARQVGRDQRTVARWWQRFNNEGNTEARHGGGNSRATTQEETRLIIQYAKDRKFVTAAQIQRELNLDCSLDTIRR